MQYISGLSIVLFLAGLVRLFHSFLPGTLQKSVGEVLIGVGLGLVINHFFHDKKWRIEAQVGIKFCFEYLLKAAIVFLGLKISIQTVQNIGGGVFFLIIGLISLALIITYILGRMTKTSPKLATLIGIGAAVCGNTAISATAPAINASDEEMSFALATNTLFGTLAVFLYPIIGQYLGLSDEFFGTWAGTAVNDTSQVVATGFAYSPLAGEIATTVKLVRNSLMGFVIILVTFLYQEKSLSQEKIPFYKKIKIPGFVLLFIVVAVLNSFGLFTSVQSMTGLPLISSVKWLTKLFILMALVGVGLNTKISSLKKIGITPLIIGLFCGAILSGTSFVVIKYFLF